MDTNKQTLIWCSLTACLVGSALAVWHSKRKNLTSGQEQRRNLSQMRDNEEVKPQDNQVQKEKKVKQMDPACCGFDRKKEGTCVATVNLYHRHLFVCTGTSDWTSNILSEDKEGFLELLTKQLKEKKSQLKGNSIKLTACDEASKDTTGTDVLLFPRGIRYRNVKIEQIPLLMNDLLNDQVSESNLIVEPIHERYVFICSHMARDPRCGICGPALVSLFNEQISGKDTGVIIRKCTHVGGHKYAGNVLVYPIGDWFGYVVPELVDPILQYILSEHNDPITKYTSKKNNSNSNNNSNNNNNNSAVTAIPENLRQFWRGRMGLSEGQQAEIVKSWGLTPPNPELSIE